MVEKIAVSPMLDAHILGPVVDVGQSSSKDVMSCHLLRRDRNSAAGVIMTDCDDDLDRDGERKSIGQSLLMQNCSDRC
jgi:hypothetical protein